MDPLDLLFARLVRAMRDTRPELLSRPLEVSELVALVPDPTVRGEGALEKNDEYSRALTRLLAGERGYVFADDLLQDDLQAELSSPNPDLAAWRAYTTSRVTISQEHARRLGESTPSTAGSAAQRTAAAPLSDAAAAPRPMRPGSAAPPRPLDAGATTAPHSSRPGCRYCGKALPEDRRVQFCPSCGQNLLERRCAACSAELEPGWRFCVTCGRLAES